MGGSAKKPRYQRAGRAWIDARATGRKRGRANVGGMTVRDRIDNASDKLKGKANQTAGRLRGDDRQKLRGHGQELKGDLKDVGTDVKESLR